MGTTLKVLGHFLHPVFSFVYKHNIFVLCVYFASEKLYSLSGQYCESVCECINYATVM